jgi:hypothetical protein
MEGLELGTRCSISGRSLRAQDCGAEHTFVLEYLCSESLSPSCVRFARQSTEELVEIYSTAGELGLDIAVWWRGANRGGGDKAWSDNDGWWCWWWYFLVGVTMME